MKFRFKWVAAVVVLATLSACSHTKSTDWKKPGGSETDFNNDANDCRREINDKGINALGLAGLPVVNDYFNTCMLRHGYTKQF
jgi:hypothetical protein